MGGHPGHPGRGPASHRGAFAPKGIGPRPLQVLNVVVDMEADDESDTVLLAKQYLSYFQGPLKEWSCADQEPLLILSSYVPEVRLAVGAELASEVGRPGNIRYTATRRRSHAKCHRDQVET